MAVHVIIDTNRCFDSGRHQPSVMNRNIDEGGGGGVYVKLLLLHFQQSGDDSMTWQWGTRPLFEPT
jgi:hypothetical protein